MALNLNVNGIIYRYPETGDINWGQATTLWAQAVTNGMLQKAGGAFTLTADADFGGSFGLVSLYYKSRSGNIAQSGVTRLARTDAVSWRNAGNSADLPLSVNSSNQLTFDGDILLTSGYNNITNANIASNAAIAYSKLAALTASRALVSDGSGVISTSAATATEVGYLSGVTSSIQTQISAKLNLAGGTMTGPLYLDVMNGQPNQAATKEYVDNAMLGLAPKAPCFVATTGNITLSGEQTIDGQMTSTSRVLVLAQTLPEENGIYVSAAGAWSRATDADTWAELVQAYTLVQDGSTYAGAGFLCTASPGGTIGTDPVSFIQFSSSTVYTTDGQGIELTGTVFSLELDGSTLSKSASGLRVDSSLVSTINAALPNPLTTTGDLIYSSSGTTGARLGIGTSGQILTVSGGLPSWQTLATNPTVVAGSTGATLTSADSGKIYIVNTGSARNFQLPTPAAGLNFYIKDGTGQAATNNISLLRAASEQIEGIAATKLLQTNWGTWRVVCDGTNWFIL